MLIKEYRIILPISLKDYQIGHLWTSSEVDKLETGGGEGVEVVVNEPREFPNGPGQYTHKVVHVETKVPRLIRMLSPKGSLELHVKSKNIYPSVKSTMSNAYMADKFQISVDTLHTEDFGDQENALNLTEEELKQREVVVIDFVNDPVDPRDYNETEDPKIVSPAVSKIGPLSAEWLKDLKNGKYSSEPHVCVYKVVRAEFIWMGLQAKVESMIQKFFHRYSLELHRRLYCWMDKWYGMTLDDIRVYEESSKRELTDLRLSGTPRGMSEK